MSAKKPATAAPQAPITLVRDIRDHIEKCLSESTALDARYRRTIAYWGLATHGLPHLQIFPILYFLGNFGCGKSQAEQILAPYVRSPRLISLRGMTWPTVRDDFAEANNGTAIVEEADSNGKISSSEFEALLSERYSRNTALAKLKVPKGEYNWVTQERPYFGATVIHRRIPFADAALDGRAIAIRFRPNYSRTYGEFDPEDATNQQVKTLARTLDLSLTGYRVPPGLPGRISNTWRPVLAVANLLGDQMFIDNIVSLHAATAAAELKEAQASEPDGLVLRAIIRHIFGQDTVSDAPVPVFSNVKLSDLHKSLWETDREDLKPRQVGKIARDLGFTVGPSHGQSVVFLNPADLLKACESASYSDPEIDKLRLDAARGVLITSLESVGETKESAKEIAKE